jgi:uncharacterized protein YndB with AHSA1/START domain
MMAEVKARRVARSIQIQASPEQVLRGFLDVEQLKPWWGIAQGLVEERKGGVWALAWGEAGQGYKYVVTGVLKSFQAGKRVRIEPLLYLNPERTVLGPMRLAISVREKAGKTRISVRQDGFGEGPEWDWYYEAVVKGWKESLRNLKEFIEGSAG